jgi:hypothetical protein
MVMDRVHRHRVGFIVDSTPSMALDRGSSNYEPSGPYPEPPGIAGIKAISGSPKPRREASPHGLKYRKLSSMISGIFMTLGRGAAGIKAISGSPKPWREPAPTVLSTGSSAL